jgi:hypothetical protein
MANNLLTCIRLKSGPRPLRSLSWTGVIGEELARFIEGTRSVGKPARLAPLDWRGPIYLVPALD